MIHIVNRSYSTVECNAEAIAYEEQSSTQATTFTGFFVTKDW